MSRWFRFYDEALNDPKVQLLPPHLFKAWVNLLCLASKNEGRIPIDNDVAFQLRISSHDAAQQIDELILAGLVDILPDGTRTPHNWVSRQYTSDSSAERTRKYRERRKKKPCDGAGDVTVTVQNRTDSETDNKTSRSLSFAAREGNDQKVLNNFLKRRNDKANDFHVRRAEGLGLDVEEIARASASADKPAAYFTTICVQRLQEKLPGIDERIIRDALWQRSPGAYQTVLGLLTVNP